MGSYSEMGDRLEVGAPTGADCVLLDLLDLLLERVWDWIYCKLLSAWISCVCVKWC